jgi:hypothetical protein
MAMFAAAEKFLAKHIGGRFQETMTPEVSKRLAEITVDPASVTMAPKPDTNVPPGASLGGKWTWTVDAPGQPVELDVDLKHEGGSFSGTGTSMIGNALIEGGKINGKALTATLRADIQGQPVEFTVVGTVDGDTISGTISGGGYGSMPFTATRPK